MQNEQSSSADAQDTPEPAAEEQQKQDEQQDPESQQESAEEPEHGAEADDGGEDENPTQKPKRSAQERIDEMTRQMRAAEREAQHWREVAERKHDAETAEKPKPESFNTYDDYVEALADWRADRRVAESLQKRDAERAKEAAERASTVRAQAWAERQSAYREATPDYDAVMSASSVQVAGHVVDTLLDSESGPELAYHLARNPATARRLNDLSPLAAAREIGRIEASLSAPAQQQSKPASKAPKPISYSRASAPAAVNLATASMDTYIAERAKQGATWARR